MPPINVYGNASGTASSGVAATLTSFDNQGTSIPSLTGTFLCAGLVIDDASATISSITDNAGNGYVRETGVAHVGAIGADMEIWCANGATGTITSLTIVSSTGAAIKYSFFAMSGVESASPVNSSTGQYQSAGTTVTGAITPTTLSGASFQFVYTGASGVAITGIAADNPGSVTWNPATSPVTNMSGAFALYSGAYTGPSPGVYPLWSLGSAHDAITAVVQLTQDPPPYAYYRVCSVDHTQCGGSSSSNFTALVSFTDSRLATVGNGGHVQNTVNVTYGSRTFAVPADAVFSSDLLGFNLLYWEWESYNASTGQCIVWVQLPTISHTVNTIFYLLYDSTTVTTYQGGAKGLAWNSNHICVYHFPDGSTLYPYDSTSNGNDGTNGGMTATTGNIDGGIQGNGTSAKITTAAANQLGDFSAILWFNSSTNAAAQRMIDKQYNTGFWMGQDATGSTNNYGGGCEQGSSPYGAYVPLSNNAWHMLAVTRSGTTWTVNGDGGAQTATATVSNTALDSTPLYIAAAYNATLGANWWNGALDEIRFMTGAVSQDWITQVYNNTKSGSTFITIGTEQQTMAFGWFIPPPQPQDNIEIVDY